MTWNPPTNGEIGSRGWQDATGYRAVRLAEAIDRADTDALFDPNTELVSVTETGGLWSVTLDRATGVAYMQDGVAFTFVPIGADGSPYNDSSDSPRSMHIVVQIVSATQGDDAWVMLGMGNVTTAVQTAVGGGLHHADATYPQTRLQSTNSTVALSTQSAQAGYDRAKGVMTGVNEQILFICTAGAVAGNALDPRPSASDTAVSGAYKSATSVTNPAATTRRVVLSVGASATGADTTITFRCWYLWTDERIVA